MTEEYCARFSRRKLRGNDCSALPAYEGRGGTGLSRRNSLAFFCRDRPDATNKASSAKNGTGSEKRNVAQVNLRRRRAFHKRSSSARRSRDLRIATTSVISRIHAASRNGCAGRGGNPTRCRQSK